jgi:hypothetical protein
MSDAAPVVNEKRREKTMATALGIGVLVLFIGAYVAYGNWLTSGIKPRSFVTRVAPDHVRELFSRTVARTGWRVVDDGNPMLAQSSLVTGIRQQIGLNLRTTKDGRTSVLVGPHRWVTKRGVPKKAHTMRMRLNAFVDAIRAEDGAISVQTRELRGR